MCTVWQKFFWPFPNVYNKKKLMKICQFSNCVLTTRQKQSYTKNYFMGFFCGQETSDVSPDPRIKNKNSAS